MNKKEKYINFIIDDLVSKTEIDYDKERIYFPFYFSSPPLLLPSFLSSSFLPSSFSKYVQKRYGARDEEMDIIWDQYKERIKELVSNE